MRDDVIAIFDRAIANSALLERKGKTMPYTSANGHMFSQVNKDGELGVRLLPADGKAFMAEHGTGPFMSYGAVMKDYVTVPAPMLDNEAAIQALLEQGYHYVMGLKTPPRKKTAKKTAK